MTTKLALNRRDFIRNVGAVALATSPMVRSANAHDRDDDDRLFQHGVASGDPLTDRVILWTRVTPENERGERERGERERRTRPERARDIPVMWEVSLDRHFNRIVLRGQTFAVAAADFTVKVDALGLRPDTRYHYRFKVRGEESPVGRTRTLPVGDVQSVKMAVFSCSNYPAGYFNAYNDAAKQPGIDVVLHLGDYIYEYGKDGFASQNAAALERVSQPETELLALADYRTRYAQYRSDPDLQVAHAAFPWICVWDDHEFTNDTWKAGAENHQSSEGDFFVRRAAALQAYYEWMPIRAVEAERPLRIFRSFNFGNLVNLHMLDTRIIGRDKQLSYLDPAYYNANGSFNSAAFSAALTEPSRQLMGAEQAGWLATAMATGRATWTVLGQQVLMGRMNIPAPLVLQQISFSAYSALVVKAQTAPATLTPQELAILGQPSIPYNLDAWDGYFVARETVLATARALNKNLVVLSGDTHNAWASDLADIRGNAVGVELGGPGVTSPGFEAFFPDENPAAVAAGLEQIIGPLVYAETEHRGYMIVTATAAECNCAWRFVDTVQSRRYSATTAKTLRTLPGAGNRKLVVA
jgi:alkaline phosphatase D